MSSNPAFPQQPLVQPNQPLPAGQPWGSPVQRGGAPASVQPQGTQQEEIDRRNPLRTLFFRFSVAFIFLRLSFLHEVISNQLGVNTYLLMLLGIPTVVGVIVVGGIRRTFQHRQALLLLGFACWMLLAIPTSSWRGGSTTIFLSYLRTEFSMLCVLGGMAMSWKECKSILAAIAASAIVNVFSSGIFGAGAEDVDYRFRLNFGSLGGSNDYAAHLLLVLPFLLFFALNPKTMKLVRLVSAGCFLYGLLTVVQTGSRGASIALLVGFGVYWLLSPGSHKVVSLLLVPLIGLGLLTFSNQQSIQRIQSLFTGKGADAGTSASGDTRWYLFTKSIEYSIMHPLWGVGPGEFGNFEGHSSREEGKHGIWMQTHNTLTQVSSENGLPALFFFVGCLTVTFRSLLRSYKLARQRGREEISMALLCTLLGFTTYTTASLFLSMAYSFYTPILCGLSIVLSMSVARESQGSLTPKAAGRSALSPMMGVRPESGVTQEPQRKAQDLRRGRRLSAALRMKS